MSGEKQINHDAAMLVTYSSVLREGSEVLVPSRLSLLTAVAARVCARASSRLIIAGEQSYRDFPGTTGDLLVQDFPHLVPDVDKTVVLPAGDNRLINTVYQVGAVSDYAKELDLRHLHIVGWGFHRERVEKLFAVYRPSLSLNYSQTEDVLASMDKKSLDNVLDELGFVVDFDTIMSSGLRKFAQRERLTRAALLLDKKGRVINALSQLRASGRYDDLSPQGEAIMGVTDQVGYRLWNRQRQPVAEDEQPEPVATLAD